MTASGTRGRRSLRRLERLVDGVFAISLVMLAINFPAPESLEGAKVVEALEAQLQGIIKATIGLAMILIYWNQNKLLCGYLARTDNKHSSIMVLQVFFVLFYLYTIELAMNLAEGPIILAMQSTGAALIGIAAAAGWGYACKNKRLLEEGVSTEDINALRLRVMAEPLTALLTLPLAFVSAFWWEIGWLAYPLIASLLRRSGRYDH